MAQGLISAGRNRRAGPRRRGLHIPRFAQKGKARSFHRSASPTQTRFAGLCVGGRLRRPLWTDRRPPDPHPLPRLVGEPGAAVKWNRLEFCTAPGPSGPEGIIPGTIFCAPEILHEGIGVSPVNGGPGENELEPEGTCSRRRCESSPGDPLVSFPSLGKKLALRGEILRVE